MKGSMSNMEQTYIALLLICIFYLRGCLCGTTVTKDQCGFSGESVPLSCTLPAAEFIQQLAWSNDIIVGDISSCTPIGCSPPAKSRYSASADANGIYMSITNLTRNDDETTWKCTLQGQSPSAVNLTVRDYPTTCAISKNSDGSFKCETDCGYPTSDLTIDWFLNTTSAVVDLSNPSISIDTTSTPVCSNGGKASATLSASNINEDGDLYCKCGMQTACPQKALIVSGSEAVTAISSSCGSCTPTNVLAALGIVVAVVCVALCWKVYFKFSESGGGKGKFKCSVTWCFRATIIATVVSVIGFILCIAGLIICVTCDDSVSSSNSVTVGFALAVVGFVFAAVTLVIVIILVILFCRGVITKKDDGQTIKHVSVKNNDPLTLTCPAGDLATTLTWTGPGGIPYVTGTTVEADLDGSVKRRISASHKKRGYALMFTEVWSSDMGIYTSTVDETVVKHEVIVEGNPEHTETNQVNPKNVTDDEKFVKKGETTDGQKATVVEMKGIDKNDKVDNV